VIYPGSIERVDFGEAQDDKFYVIVDVHRGKTEVQWCPLIHIRPFIDRHITLKSDENILDAMKAALPPVKKLAGAVVRLSAEYPREWETLIDEQALRDHAAEAFEFHLVRRPQIKARLRLPADQTVSSLSPLELVELYWKAGKIEDTGTLLKMAKKIIEEDEDETVD
jgi:exonuclease SbcD